MRTMMAVFICTILLFSLAKAATLKIKMGGDLQKVIDLSNNNDTIIIAPGTYEADNNIFIDSLCGNCQEHQSPVEASFGFIIADKSLVIIGNSRDKTTLITNAGYGLFIVNSPGTSISNLTITGGIRDKDGNATDAAIVVRNSTVKIFRLNIIDNNNRADSVVVGIGGIFGREGSEIIISECDIIGNGWDGVALYRGATAVIKDCLIKDGRGVGIGVTWDATCIAYRNIVTGYWKGIGAFGTSWLAARNNAVFDNLGWGMIATGKAYMDITNNVIHHNGNCGTAIWSAKCTGRITNNIITSNGWREQWVCPCVGVWNYGDWSKWDFSYNIVWNNVDGDYRDIWDQTNTNNNLSVDPGFYGESIFILKENSLAVDAGHPEISDPNGSRSDIGLTGGPQGRLK